MTREEAIADIRDNIKPLVGGISLDMAIKALEQEPREDCISRQAVLDKLNRLIEVERLQGTDEMGYGRERVSAYENMMFEIESEYLYPSVTPQERKAEWIPCSERLPKINKVVLLSTNAGDVIIGHQEKPNLIWQVTENDGRKHWVYDPESYTDDVESLPKAEDCSFEQEAIYTDGLLSVTSPNYNERWGGVIAWMPLPEPYNEGGKE